MPVPSATREKVRRFLPPGDEIVYVFPATMPMSMPGYVFVAVSTTAILVLSTGWRSRTEPKRVWARYPRTTRLGPLDTTGTASFYLGGALFEVDEEYVAVLNAADAELARDDPGPPDPLPHL